MEKMMKIIIGAGDQRIDGFVTCDYDPKTNPDYIFNLETDTFPFEDNSVDVVLASHVFEHLGEGYFHCLKEIYRVCRDKAIVHVHVPHHRHDDFFSDPTHRRPITVDGLKMLGMKYCDLAKRQNVHCTRLAHYLEVDFEVVHHSYRPVDKYKDRFEQMPKEEAEEYIEQHNNIIDEVYVKLMVIKDE